MVALFFNNRADSMKQTNKQKLNELMAEMNEEQLKNFHEYVLLKLRVREMEREAGIHD